MTDTNQAEFLKRVRMHMDNKRYVPTVDQMNTYLKKNGWECRGTLSLKYPYELIQQYTIWENINILLINNLIPNYRNNQIVVPKEFDNVWHRWHTWDTIDILAKVERRDAIEVFLDIVKEEEE